MISTPRELCIVHVRSLTCDGVVVQATLGRFPTCPKLAAREVRSVRFLQRSRAAPICGPNGSETGRKQSQNDHRQCLPVRNFTNRATKSAEKVQNEPINRKTMQWCKVLRSARAPRKRFQDVGCGVLRLHSEV